MFRGGVVGRGVMPGTCCSQLGLQVYTGSFTTGQQGEMVCSFSQGRHLCGLGSVRQGIGRLSTGYESRMSQSLILTDTLSSDFKTFSKGHIFSLSWFKVQDLSFGFISTSAEGQHTIAPKCPYKVGKSKG
jgi:hypothetical protein